MENNINNLPHEDGTNREEDLEKDKKELEKNLNKAVDDAEKVIDDINTAEAKPFKEKLILPEEDDSFLFEELEEEVVDEAVPKELVKPFKRAYLTDRGGRDSEINKFGNDYTLKGYKAFDNHPSARDGANISKLDFQNSTYTPITPEEALELKKNGEANKVLAIVDGQLVAFNKDGKQLYRANKSWSSDAKKFTRPNGEVMQHTGKLTYSTVINNADKLYKAEEVLVPDEVLLKRRANPESKGFDTYPVASQNIAGQSIGLTGRVDNNNRHATRYDIASCRDNIEDYKKSIAEYTQKLTEVDPESQEYSYYKDRLERAKYNLDYYRKKLSSALNYEKDVKARLRYLNSELEFTKVFNNLKTLKNEISSLTAQANRATDDVNRTRELGAPSTRENKEKLENLKQQLKDIQRRIIEAEIMLDGCDEDDAAELAAVQATLDSIEAKKKAKEDELKSLFRRNKTEEIEEECQIDEDIPALNKIKKAGKVGELNNLISDLYPEGITNDQLKDILTYEDDYILDTLGVGEDNE